MSTAMAETTTARPLRVLVPLIQEDLQAGRDASERAGLPYYQAAGEKMLEAKTQLAHGEFQSWIERNFKITIRHARRYMQLATAAGAGQKGLASPFSSLSDFIRKETADTNYNKPHTVRPTQWHEPVKEIVSRVDTDRLNIKREELKRADEREAQRELALQLINIGYRVLATKLHPDKNKDGSKEAMWRLNAVRDRLKLHA
jgi:Protein of unknown function (DUF3102)